LGTKKASLAVALALDAHTAPATPFTVIRSILRAVGFRHALGICNIHLEDLSTLLLVLNDIAIFTGPPRNTEAVTIGTDTILQTLRRAGQFTLACAACVARLAEALTKAAQALVITSRGTCVLRLDGAIGTVAAFDTEASA